jgi:mannose-6-phosphate isomerase-like protein (cupin superfamily)
MGMHFSLDDFEKVGRVVKKSDVYTVLDITRLDNLVVSLTILHPGKETGGHSHGDADEVYFFVGGNGKIKIDDKKSDARKGDVILIPRGSFHKVFNTGNGDLKFMCVFEKYGDRS